MSTDQLLPRFVYSHPAAGYQVLVKTAGKQYSRYGQDPRELGAERDSVLFHIKGVRDPDRFSFGPYSEASPPPVLAWTREILAKVGASRMTPAVDPASRAFASSPLGKQVLALFSLRDANAAALRELTEQRTGFEALLADLRKSNPEWSHLF